MRKIPTNLENPLDNIIINICEPVSTLFYKINFTPNDITTLSLIFGFLSIIFLYKGMVIITVIFYFLSYCFDCLDGYYARKYKMCTKFGDLYDHIKDWTVNITYAYVLISRNKHKLSTKQWTVIASMFIFLIAMQALYFGAQERYYGKLDQVPSLAWLGSIVKTKQDAEKILSITRYFGCGTFIMFIVLITLYLEYK